MTEEQAREKTAKRIADKLKEWKVEKHLGETETSVEMMLAWREDCIRALLAEERVKELERERDYFKEKWHIALSELDVLHADKLFDALHKPLPPQEPTP